MSDNTVSSDRKPATSSIPRSYGMTNGSMAFDAPANLNGALSALGGGGNAWNANSIWSKASGGGTASNNARVPRVQSGEVEGKTGSGSLMSSSTSDEDYSSYRSKWSRFAAPTASSAAQLRQQENAKKQPQPLRIDSAQTHAGATQGLPSFTTSRQPTVNLTSTTIASRPSFSSQRSTGLIDQYSEGPPSVFTKHDRPVEPPHRRPDSGLPSWTTTPSPTEERRPYLIPNPLLNGSIPVSREGSVPPPYPSNESAMSTRYDQNRLHRRDSNHTSQAASFSSQHNAIQASAADSLALQFGQLKFNTIAARSGASASSHVTATGMARRSPQASLDYSFVPVARTSSNSVGSVDNPDGMDGGRLGSYSRPSTGYGSTYNDRLAQAAAMSAEFRPDQAGNLRTGPPSRGQSGVDFPRPENSWMTVDGNVLANTSFESSPSIDDQDVLDLRMRQMMALQAQQFAGLYNPYAVQQFGFVSPYARPTPSHGHPIASRPGTRDGSNPEGMQSKLMFEFKSNPKSKNLNIRDVIGHFAEFAGDQYGSRFIQTKLETATSEEKEWVFREIEPNTIQLAIDVFGNYVVQKLFEHGDQAQKKALANNMKGRVLNLSMQTYGCRVVQKALEHVLVDQQAALISELEGHVIDCVKDCNGNHVIQKAIERCPASTIGFIIDAFRGQVQFLSVHTYGCRVIQRCFEKGDLPSKDMIMAELRDGIQSMIPDQYGNYVVQHIVAHDEGDGRRRVLNIVAQNLENYSKHKFASNVVEKCLEKADDHWRQQILQNLLRHNAAKVDGEGVLVGLVKDQFGNYVIQKLLETLGPHDWQYFVDALHPAMAQVKRTGPGKQVMAIEKKMHRFPMAPYHHHHATMTNPYQTQRHHIPHHVMSMPAPPPLQLSLSYGQMGGAYGLSAANTPPPPPLTGDSSSMQSSGLPSLNGDAMEGAIMMGKGFDNY